MKKKAVKLGKTKSGKTHETARNACKKMKLVSGGSGGGEASSGEEPKQITIVVNSNIDSVVERVSQQFSDYHKIWNQVWI